MFSQAPRNGSERRRTTDVSRRPTRFTGRIVGDIARDRSTHFTADLLAAIFTWGGIGWLADRLLGTAPVLMVIGFVIGNAAGLFLLYHRTRDVGTAVEDAPDNTDSGEPRSDHA